MLPDRNRSLQLVDQGVTSGKCVFPVLGPHRGHDGEVADLEITSSVHDGQGHDRMARSDLLRDPAELDRGRRMSAVGQCRDAAPVVMITNNADKQGNSACRRVSCRSWLAPRLPRS